MERETVNVLLIEDSHTQATELATMLQDETYYVYRPVILHTLRTSLPILQKHSFDLIILDLVLPNGAGLEVLRSIRDVAAETPIVVWTGLHEADLEWDAMNGLADDFIIKGKHNQENMLGMIRRAVRRYRSVRPLLKPSRQLVAELRETLDECRTDPAGPPFAESVANCDPLKDTMKSSVPPE